MNNTKLIAELLGISAKDAIAYCEEVRRRTGLGSALHYRAIAYYLILLQTISPSPLRIAEMINENKAKIVLGKKQTKSSKMKSGRWNVEKARAKEQRSLGERSAKPAPSPKNLIRNSPVDQERVSDDKLKHCPHGVAQGRICAICEPEKFREMTGID